MRHGSPGRVGKPASVVVLLAVALGAPTAAGATEPAATFNAAGQRHNNTCVRLASPPAALRFSDGTPTGFSLFNDLPFDEDGRCPNGTVRLDLHETLPSAQGPLVFHRGGNGYVDEANVKYGELASGDIVGALPPPVPSSGGRGAACVLADEPAYRVNVQSIPAPMHYKRPQDVPGGSNNGTSFLHYGDPGSDQGSRHDIHYSYLLWSFLNVRGGGIVRALLAPSEVVRPCDVEPVTMDSWDSAGNANGAVTARYVRVLAGTCPLYGWMVWSHSYDGDASGPVAHATAAPGLPPPDPAPDASCPVAELASPPLAATGDAQPADGGTATLSATVNPKGVPATYHFEFGLDTSYGASTQERSLSSTDGDVPVSAQLTGLQAGATYHYRLVASSTHGAGLGEDRTFTVPAPPPLPASPPPSPPQPAPAPPAQAAAPRVVVSRLSVTPRSFRRTRRPGGAAARIEYTLSSPGTVTIAFVRAVTGVRSGRGCRPLPRGGLPRGARRCTRWVAVKGSVQKRSGSGAVSVAFGGWLGRTPLPAGRYRVQATPMGPAGDADGTRLAGFTLVPLRSSGARARSARGLRAA